MPTGMACLNARKRRQTANGTGGRLPHRRLSIYRNVQTHFRTRLPIGYFVTGAHTALRTGFRPSPNLTFFSNTTSHRA